MTSGKKGGGKKEIESYRHVDKERVNNPPVGLVTPDIDQDSGKKSYEYDTYCRNMVGIAFQKVL